TRRDDEIDAAFEQDAPMFVEPGDQVRYGKHGMVTQPARHSARVTRLADTSDPVVAHIAANTRNGPKCNLAGDHDGTLLDMQFEIGFRFRFVEQRFLSRYRG